MEWKLFWQAILATFLGTVLWAVVSTGVVVRDGSKANAAEVAHNSAGIVELKSEVDSLKALQTDLVVVKNDVKWIRESLEKK